MTRLLFIVLLLSLLSSPGYSYSVSQGAIEGDWVGEFRVKGEAVFIRAHFKAGEKGIKATADIPLQQKRGLEVTNFGLSSPQVHFELLLNSEKLVFDGQLKDATISGELERAGKRGSFQLIHLAAVAPNIFSRYTAKRPLINYSRGGTPPPRSSSLKSFSEQWKPS